MFCCTDFDEFDEHGVHHEHDEWHDDHHGALSCKTAPCSLTKIGCLHASGMAFLRLMHYVMAVHTHQSPEQLRCFHGNSGHTTTISYS